MSNSPTWWAAVTVSIATMIPGRTSLRAEINHDEEPRAWPAPELIGHPPLQPSSDVDDIVHKSTNAPSGGVGALMDLH